MCVCVCVCVCVYCHSQTHCFVGLELFSVARHVGRLKTGMETRPTLR